MIFLNLFSSREARRQLTRSRRARHRARRRALSLVEVVFSTVLVGLVLLGASRGVGAVFFTWRTSERQHLGMALTQDLMSEILQQRYREPVDTPAFGIEPPESSTTRASWDDVDDYHNWTASVQDRNGNLLPGYSGWTRSVRVAYVSVTNPENTISVDEGLKRITVTVTDPQGRKTEVIAFRAQAGVLEQRLDADTTVSTCVNNSLQVGNGTRIYNGAMLRNHAEDQ